MVDLEVVSFDDSLSDADLLALAKHLREGLGKLLNMSRDARKPVFRVSDQVQTNQPVQSQKMTSGMKFLIDCASYVAKNKGADMQKACFLMMLLI